MQEQDNLTRGKMKTSSEEGIADYYQYGFVSLFAAWLQPFPKSLEVLLAETNTSLSLEPNIHYIRYIYTYVCVRVYIYHVCILLSKPRKRSTL